LTVGSSNKAATLKEVQSIEAALDLEQPDTSFPRGDSTMYAFVVLLLAALSRLVPHMMHGTGINLTAVGAGLLMFGSRRPRWQAIIAVAIIALTDIYLTKFVYGFPFHTSGYLVTWAWYGVLCVIASGLLHKVSFLRVAAGVLVSATGFYVLVDFALWARGNMYPHTLAGLGACYVAALPFYGNDLVCTAGLSAVFFGLPVLAKMLAQQMQDARNSHTLQP
jgi:hypothetical protein